MALTLAILVAGSEHILSPPFVRLVSQPVSQVQTTYSIMYRLTSSRPPKLEAIRCHIVGTKLQTGQ